jgi:hypothetical protein
MPPEARKNVISILNAKISTTLPLVGPSYLTSPKRERFSKSPNTTSSRAAVEYSSYWRVINGSPLNLSWRLISGSNGEVNQDDIPLRLMQTSLRFRLSRMPHGRHIKEDRKKIRMGNLSLDGRSHQTGDAAFTPATPHDSHHSRANTDSHNSHNTQHTSLKQNELFFMQKDTQPSQTCSGGHITSNPTQNRCGRCLFAYGEYKLD